ncbi:GntR family transcriptional regulator [Tenggerimyces flavus]|uniref:GntR family transcriptional regulator n=1 Tax=Tenggerimyces flavus TaxID=1708749 RepID=A0ABV7YH72_9ACTN|nr:GntR family transcriptional regulator [Tenggerimyces flavus]MBM7787216.1 DNA-binding GntR family transcriptional regulator [Tenggerimyces flavus]
MGRRSDMEEGNGLSAPFSETPLVPASTPALAETVADRLRETIAQGQFAPGQHLREAELADALQVSRGPVREALAQLEREGLVVLRRHRGAQVAELSRADIEEVYTLRLALEQLAVKRAAERARPEHFAVLDSVLEQMSQLRDDYTARDAAALDVAFHDVVYQAADHRRLLRSWEQIRSQVYAFLYTRNVARHDFNEIAFREHTELRDLLAAGDAVAAQAAIETHLEGAYLRLVEATGE